MDFFIAGYPKCGTTSLYSYLKDHPDVFLPSLKEPHYFSFDRPGARIIQNEADYVNMYKHAHSSQLKGDASASVIHSEVALDHILAWNPKAKFIIILREPTAAVQSFHGEMLHNLNEKVKDFEEAWRMQRSRYAGKFIPETCREPSFLQYGKVFHYREQLPKFFNKVPTHQRCVLIFEEFFSNPRKGYMEVLDFLAIKDDGRSEFSTQNSAKQHRFRKLAEAHHKIVKRNGALYQSSKKILSQLGIHPSHIISRFNGKPKSKVAINPSFEAELRRYFELDVKAVEHLIGRNIESWRR